MSSRWRKAPTSPRLRCSSTKSSKPRSPELVGRALKVVALVTAYCLADREARFGGETLIELACRALRESSRVDEVLVTHEQDWHPATRDADLLVVHDPSCALTPASVIRSVIDMVRSGEAEAAVPAEPVTDTIKVVDSSNALRNTWDRGRLRSIQSPLCCRAELVAELRQVPTVDDLQHGQLRLVPGDPLGIAMHGRFDMIVAETLRANTFGGD